MNSIKFNWYKLNRCKLNWYKVNWCKLNWCKLNPYQLNWIDASWIQLNWIDTNQIDTDQIASNWVRPRNSQLTKDLRYQARGNIKISVKRRMSYLKEAEPILIIVLKRTQAFPELAPCFWFPGAPLCLLSWSRVNL